MRIVRISIWHYLHILENVHARTTILVFSDNVSFQYYRNLKITSTKTDIFLSIHFVIIFLPLFYYIYQYRLEDKNIELQIISANKIYEQNTHPYILNIILINS